MYCAREYWVWSVCLCFWYLRSETRSRRMHSRGRADTPQGMSATHTTAESHLSVSTRYLPFNEISILEKQLLESETRCLLVPAHRTPCGLGYLMSQLTRADERTSHYYSGSEQVARQLSSPGDKIKCPISFGILWIDDALSIRSKFTHFSVPPGIYTTCWSFTIVVSFLQAPGATLEFKGENNKYYSPTATGKP